MKYDLSKGIWKGIIAFICFILPFLVTTFPDIANLTIGAVAIVVVNFIKVRYTK